MFSLSLIFVIFAFVDRYASVNLVGEIYPKDELLSVEFVW